MGQIKKDTEEHYVLMLLLAIVKQIVISWTHQINHKHGIL